MAIDTFTFTDSGEVEGGPDSRDASLTDVTADFNEWRQRNGLAGRVYARGGRKKIRTVSLSDDAMDGLRFLAQAFGTYFGSEVSVSAFLEAIGTFQLQVSDELRSNSRTRGARR